MDEPFNKYDPKVLEQARIEKLAKAMVDRMFEAKGKDPFTWRFRSSALPICQVDMALSKMTQVVDRAIPREWNFRADFYTGIGTGLHSAIQRWLGKIGVLFGHWQCDRCKITLYNLLGTQMCPECTREMTYEEFTLEDPENDFTGHCDGVLKLRSVDKPFLFELKSMGTARGDKLEATGELPIWYHLLQTNAYVHLLRKKKGIDIGGVVFMYVPRNIDEIFKSTKVFVHTKINTASRVYLNTVKEYNEAKAALRDRKYGDLNKLCNDADEAPKCPWNKLFCFSGSYEKHLKELTTEYESMVSK